QAACGIELQNRRVGWPTIDADRAAGRHGVETAMEDPDVAITGDMHSNDLSPAATVHVLRDARPPFHQPIGIGKVGRFGVLGLGVRRAPKRDDDGSTGESAHRTPRPTHGWYFPGRSFSD